MNNLIINISIVLLNLCILINLTASAELGQSSCRYSASYDKREYVCHVHPVELKYLPNECTSIVYDGFTCNLDYSILPNKPRDDEFLKKIIEYEEDESSSGESSPRSVFLFFSHGNQDGWKTTLCFGDIDKIVKSLNTFILDYPVDGLILSGIGNPVSCPNKNFYQVFSNYVQAIKGKLPYLKIGLYLSARTLVECLNNNNNNCFNFTELNRSIDFYLFEFATFNTCGTDFLYSGITPYESADPNRMTLKKFQDALQRSGILKSQVYLEFLIRPISQPGDKNHESCELSYGEYCRNEHGERKGHWCADSNKILYTKGQFANNISSGFLAMDIDLVDRDAKCNCNDDNKFFSFFMLFNGFTGKTPLHCKQLI